MKILKISKINNFGIFKNFDWGSSLVNLTNPNQTYDFKDINIFYGRNYSGKTSLSKIIRSLETKTISTKYQNPDFEITLADSSIIAPTSLPTFTHPIHVYNSDFVKENLKFIHDETQDVESFSVTLGGDNQQILDRINELKEELGSEEDGAETGIYLSIKQKKIETNSADTAFKNKNIELQGHLNNKASGRADSIRTHHIKFGDSNYNITKLNREIHSVLAPEFIVLNESQIQEYESLITQRDLPEPSALTSFTLKLEEFIQSTDSILKTVVGGSSKIEELVTNGGLNSWVQTGTSLHNDREICAFCANQISEKRREELRQHFDEDTQKLQTRIEGGIKFLDIQLQSSELNISLNINQYYEQHHPELLKLEEELKTVLDQQKDSIEQLRSLLEQKRGKLFTEIRAEYPKNYSAEIQSILEKIEGIRTSCIKLSSELSTKQNLAKNALRLNHIYQFLQDINFKSVVSDIDRLKLEIEPYQNELQALETKKEKILNDIKVEEDKLKSESEACTRINNILEHDFGHQALRLEAVEVITHQGKNIKFEIQRNEVKAHNLSEGECSLISFCYFLAKIQDDLEQCKKPIIWIDDPISSLDSNHIFFIYSLINDQICSKKKFSQLFISTHNLEFLKYLKRLDTSFNNNGATPNLKVSKYLIQREKDNSVITIMPVYMSEYATEFNYLFKQIHTCATASLITDQNHSCFYNFGNNARKFIEIYSFYKFPSHMTDDERLKLFWDDENLHRFFVGRINNELSHCSGVFERGMSIIDEAEMQKAAKAIICKVQDDIRQYNALLESVGIELASDALHPANQVEELDA